MSVQRRSALAEGLVGEMGLLAEEQFARAEELIARIAAEGIETIRLTFADQHGVIRGKTVVAEAFASAVKSGMAVTSTLLLKDTSHRTVFPVWTRDAGFGAGMLTGASDILLVPDPATFRVVPWSPHSAWILCDLYLKDGTPIPFSSRTILKNSVAKLAEREMALICGLEVEFYVYALEDARLTHAETGMPPAPPKTGLVAHGYQYLTESRYDALEDIMDELRRNAVKLGMPVRSMEAEFGPSQCEFTFEPATALEHADTMLLFRSMVKALCARRGLHATFMCRPQVENGMASGWHLHQSVVSTVSGENLFMPGPDGALTPAASGWIAGLLAHARESCLLTTPTVNGYKRYQAFQLAPDRVQWGRDNKGAMIRGLMAPGDRASRIENRVAEPAANPYLYFASQILGGLDGIRAGREAPAPVENPYETDAKLLPRSLIAAVEAFEGSELFRAELGADFVRYLAHIKRAEWERYLSVVSDWEQREYFTTF
ncbi:glutamine synthetase family protein [Oceanicella sp. SM1341]|uniref:glutamine synthetase family protein n=1 Tax=Oceanicella sp. SM1341 TaxID=1548889 RepID=UPI000E519B09|nr:glutamine synthetase family protein [Oceanicella sp. SM1341]